MLTNNHDFYDEKLRYYNRLYRGALLATSLAILIAVIIAVRKIYSTSNKVDTNVLNTRIIIENAQASTRDARKSNEARQEDIKNYVKCIVLLPYDNPSFLTTRPTREVAAAALDRCAGK